MRGSHELLLRMKITKVCINDCLVKEGYAAEYDGGKREKVKVVEKQDQNEDVPFGD